MDAFRFFALFSRCRYGSVAVSHGKDRRRAGDG
jgi:hypothetical protein